MECKSWFCNVCMEPYMRKDHACVPDDMSSTSILIEPHYKVRSVFLNIILDLSSLSSYSPLL